jgi:5-hydroxyisourate hydrolase-like protein (transthyretin family)
LAIVVVLLGASSVVGALQTPQGQIGAFTGAPAKGTVAGVVLRSTTGDPIPRATVTLTRVGAGPQGGPRGGQQPQQAGAPQRGQQQGQPAQQQGTTFTATTDDQGKFVLRDVDEGPYRLYAARNGFVRAEYGQRSVNRPGTVVTVREGQQLADVSFRLTPAGTISGRVMDSTGEPLPGVTVQALRSTYDATGKRGLQPAGTARTNDLGEYRIYWINPGRYFISANAARSAFEMITTSASQAAVQAQDAAQAQAAAAAASLFGPAGNQNEVVDNSFGLTYYPGSSDAARAVGIDLQPGAELRAIDFTLARTQRVRLSGRVIDASTGRPPQGAQVSVTPRDAASSSPFDALLGMDPSGGNRYNPATGEFVLPSVANGSYWLQVLAQGATPPQGATPTTEEALAMLNSMNTARIPVEVQGSNIDNLTLTVTPGVSVPGHVRIDGSQANPADLQRIGISLQSISGGASFLTMLQAGGGRPAQDGSFSIPRITAGDYKLVVNGLGPNLYLKEARLGQSDAVGVVTISEPVNGSLEIVLRPNPGQVTGNVVDATMKPVTGVQVVLIPERARDRQDLYKTAGTDQEGRFTFRGITPGDYRIFAWEDIEPFSYFDASVLNQYEAAGKAVRVQEGAMENAEVRLIPMKQN